MKSRDKVFRALVFLFIILGCGSLMQIGNRLLTKPVLAIVTDSAAEQSATDPPQLQNNNRQVQSGEKTAQPSNNNASDSSSSDNAEQSLIEQILHHQTQEGNAILGAELKLREEEIREELDQFTRDRKQEMENALKTKEAAINQELVQSLDQKSAADQVALRKFEQDLEESQKINLVNLRLRLMALSLDRKSDSFREEEQDLMDSIEQIRQEISQKSETERIRLQNENQEYEAAARLKSGEELAEYKKGLEEAMNSKIATYKEQLEQELKTWRDKQEKNLSRSIELRKDKQ